MLIHDELERGSAVAISGPRLEELARYESSRPRDRRDQFHFSGPGGMLTAADHVDPVPGFEGRWLAGFAPVGDTDYVVIVQTRYEDAVEVPQRALLRILSWCGAVLAVGVVIVVLTARFLARRRRAARA